MRRKPELTKEWKFHVNAEVAGKIEYIIRDPITGRPKYSVRGKLMEALLRNYLDLVSGLPEAERHPIPKLEELRAL